MTWVYQQTEPRLFTVGWEDAAGKWHPDAALERIEGAATHE
jgi:hypothetical protein